MNKAHAVTVDDSVIMVNRAKKYDGGESGGHTAGTNDVRTVEQKALTDQRHVTLAADEALVVPVTIVKRRKLDRA